jgi:cytoskeletal protein RodZ
MSKGNFGELLKREREMREISLNELTVATRVPLTLLEALENEDWDKLPGGIFNRGFIRAIAQFLGLSEEKLLAEYDLAHGQDKVATPPPYNPIPSPSKWLVAGAALAILLVIAAAIVGGLYGWRRFAAQRAAKKALAASVQPQSQAPRTPPNLVFGEATTPPSPGLDLSISTSTATRIRVKGDGKLLLDGDVAAGETRHFSAAQQFEVTAANPAGVLLELNGQAIPPLNAARASGTIVLSQKNLRQAHSGNSEP